MRKLVAVACLAVGVAAVPGPVSADPIGTNGCAVGASGEYECDLYADYANPASVLDFSAADPGWLVGYTFLLNSGADVSDGFQEADVAHALVIHSWGFELFSNFVGSSGFGTVFSAALALLDIDGTSLADGQIVGAPISGGVTELDGVGYFFTAPTVSMQSQIAWGLPGDIGGYDTLRIHTSLPAAAPPEEPPTTVPEPSSLALLAFGSVGAFVAGRRRRV